MIKIIKLANIPFLNIGGSLIPIEKILLIEDNQYDDDPKITITAVDNPTRLETAIRGLAAKEFRAFIVAYPYLLKDVK